MDKRHSSRLVHFLKTKLETFFAIKIMALKALKSSTLGRWKAGPDVDLASMADYF